MTENRKHSNQQHRSRPSLREGVRWTCPFCEKWKTNYLAEDDGKGAAVTALRSHIQSSVGGGHGPRNALPDGLDLESLREHVVYAD